MQWTQKLYQIYSLKITRHDFSCCHDLRDVKLWLVLQTGVFFFLHIIETFENGTRMFDQYRPVSYSKHKKHVALNYYVQTDKALEHFLIRRW